jgi:hypothetical protein
MAGFWQMLPHSKEIMTGVCDGEGCEILAAPSLQATPLKVHKDGFRCSPSPQHQKA